MAVYMITYDLNATGQKYEHVIQAIKDSSLNKSFCSYWKSSWLIKSNLSAQQISDRITMHMDNNDRLIVVEAKPNFQGWLTEEEWKFIQEKIFN